MGSMPTNPKPIVALSFSQRESNTTNISTPTPIRYQAKGVKP